MTTFLKLPSEQRCNWIYLYTRVPRWNLSINSTKLQEKYFSGPANNRWLQLKIPFFTAILKNSLEDATKTKHFLRKVVSVCTLSNRVQWQKREGEFIEPTFSPSWALSKWHYNILTHSNLWSWTLLRNFKFVQNNRIKNLLLLMYVTEWHWMNDLIFNIKAE